MFFTPKQPIDALETEGALRVVLLASGPIALEHLGDGTLVVLTPVAARGLAGILTRDLADGLYALPDGFLLVVSGPDLAVSKGFNTLVFLRREARDLVGVLDEIHALAADLGEV